MVKYCPNKLKRAKNYLFWNGTIRLFIANYLNVVLLSLLNLKVLDIKSMFKDDQFESIVASNWLSIIFFSLCILVPIGVSIYYYLNDHRINEK